MGNLKKITRSTDMTGAPRSYCKVCGAKRYRAWMIPIGLFRNNKYAFVCGDPWPCYSKWKNHTL